MVKNNNRPVYLNLFKISMPVTAVVSIAHRIAGVLMVMAIPLCVYLLDLSLSSAEGYARTELFFQQQWVKALGVLLAWSIAHHLANGMRILLIDIDVGCSKPAARFSAWFVHGFALVMAVFVMGAWR